MPHGCISRADRLFSFIATSLLIAFVVMEEPPSGTPPEPVPASDDLERGDRRGLRGDGMFANVFSWCAAGYSWMGAIAQWWW